MLPRERGREVQPRFGQATKDSPRSLGAIARDEARPDSDVDCLVEFDKPVGLFAFIGLKLYLEEILGTNVDLAEPEALPPKMRDRILSEAIRAA
ncbi:MAG: nucleotidyltransferase family protein [Planctomycetota bacterium]